MKATRNYMFVRIDKKAQEQKRGMIGNTGLYRHIDHAYMQHNLQYGEITAIGEKAQEMFPDARIGDYAVFHHGIEGDPDLKAEERIIDTLPNGDEIRWIDASCNEKNRATHPNGYEIYAVIKPGTMEFIPAEQHVFFETRGRRLTNRPQTSTILLDDNFLEDDSQLTKRVEELSNELKRLGATYERTDDQVEKADIWRVINGITKESERITKYLHSDKIASVKVFAINSKTSRELGVKEGDTVLVIEDYLDGLDIMGMRLVRILKEDVIGKVVHLTPEATA